MLIKLQKLQITKIKNDKNRIVKVVGAMTANAQSTITNLWLVVLKDLADVRWHNNSEA